MATFIGIVRFYIIWIYVVVYSDLFASTNTASSNSTNDTSSFSFPYVKPDPYPVVLQGPAGEIFNFTKNGYTTFDSFTISYTTVPPGGGPAPHIHHWTDEWFFFPEGGIVLF
jgi:mannose-6-phosphate isomerase-like protein (cupin superfamily)